MGNRQLQPYMNERFQKQNEKIFTMEQQINKLKEQQNRLLLFVQEKKKEEHKKKKCYLSWFS